MTAGINNREWVNEQGTEPIPSASTKLLSRWQARVSKLYTCKIERNIPPTRREVPRIPGSALLGTPLILHHIMYMTDVEEAVRLLAAGAMVQIGDHHSNRYGCMRDHNAKISQANYHKQIITSKTITSKLKASSTIFFHDMPNLIADLIFHPVLSVKSV